MNAVNGDTLRRLWNGYSEVGYEKVYDIYSTDRLKKTMSNLFVKTGGRVVDIGCGTGMMFYPIIHNIEPIELLAIDWSEKMMEKAKKEAEGLRARYNSHINFNFANVDLTKALPLHDNTFDGAISNLVVCYLEGGWQQPIREMHRVLKPEGYLYISTFLDKMGFLSVIWKIGWLEVLLSPRAAIFDGFRLRTVADRIVREARKNGAEQPSQDKLVAFLMSLGFEEIKIAQIYRGLGVAIRARKQNLLSGADTERRLFFYLSDFAILIFLSYNLRMNIVLIVLVYYGYSFSR